MAFETSGVCRYTLHVIVGSFMSHMHYADSLFFVDELLLNLQRVNSGDVALPCTFGLGISSDSLSGCRPVPRRVAQLRRGVGRCASQFFRRVAHEVCGGRVGYFDYTWRDEQHQECAWGCGELRVTAFTQTRSWFLRVERAG
jgi:hypothetical protein